MINTKEQIEEHYLSAMSKILKEYEDIVFAARHKKKSEEAHAKTIFDWQCSRLEEGKAIYASGMKWQAKSIELAQKFLHYVNSQRGWREWVWDKFTSGTIHSDFYDWGGYINFADNSSTHVSVEEFETFFEIVDSN